MRNSLLTSYVKTWHIVSSRLNDGHLEPAFDDKTCGGNFQQIVTLIPFFSVNKRYLSVESY